MNTWIPLREWAKRQGINEGAARMRVAHGKNPPKTKKVGNTRLVLVPDETPKVNGTEAPTYQESADDLGWIVVALKAKRDRLDRIISLIEAE